MRKNIMRLLAGSLVLVVLAISCGKDFLDTKPYGSVNNALLSTSGKGANALLIAAYSNLDGFSSWNNGTPWGGAASNWTFGSIVGGDAYKGSEGGDQPDITPIELGQTTPVNPYVEGKWRNYYDGISRANQALIALNALSSSAIGDTEKKTRIAEAKALRAWFHFDLWQIFRHIPYITEDLTDVRVGNTADALPKIEADLQAAISDLPVNQPEIGRMTKGTAQSILGMCYMWEKKFSDAKGQFDAVVNSGRYSLNAKYSDNFNAATRNSAEGILEVQQSVNDGTTDNGNNGDVLNFPYNGGPAGCCGFHQPSQDLVNHFQVTAAGIPDLTLTPSTLPDFKNDDGLASKDPFTPDTTTPVDPRLDRTVGRRGIPYLDWGKHPGSNWIRSQSYAGPYSPIKNTFYQSQIGSLTSSSGWTGGYNANNTKLIRLSDVMLQLAEAEVELGNLGRALELVNMIRTRAANTADWVMDGSAYAANYTISNYPSFPDADYARKAVRWERRIELGMEGHRFFDLVRWGVAADVKTAYYAHEGVKRPYLKNGTFKAGVSEIQPIPTKAITLSSIGGKATLTQNPGY